MQLFFFDQIPSGTVVRVRMVNFMSCGDTEMRPGPGFNVVIGPNGTGKFAYNLDVSIIRAVSFIRDVPSARRPWLG